MLDPRRELWDRKIIGWDQRRYAPGIFARMAATSIRRRLLLAAEEVAALSLPNDLILDAGCGTGRLIEQLSPDQNLRYQGFDFSAKAIELARKRAHATNISHEFFCDDVSSMQSPVDGLVALGFSDWVDDEELLSLLLRTRPRWAVISFTLERALDPYRAYRRWVDRNAYRARTFSRSQVENLIRRSGLRVVRVKSTGGGSPGSLWVCESCPP